MYKAFFRLVPAVNAYPTPGQDTSATQWQSLMRRGEVALFKYDSTTYAPLSPTGEPCLGTMMQACAVFSSLSVASAVAAGNVSKNPKLLCALYRQNGRWIETRTRSGLDRRNAGLNLILIVLRNALVGVPAVTLGEYSLSKIFHSEPVAWLSDATMVLALVFWALGVGTILCFLISLGHLRLVKALSSAALEPIGSRRRREVYEALAARPNQLLPLEITLEPSAIEWQDSSKHDEWTSLLSAREFSLIGQFRVVESGVLTEIWMNQQLHLVAEIIDYAHFGTWMSAGTLYEDGSIFEVANRESFGVDRHPKRTMIYLGSNATGENVIETAVRDRPAGESIEPSPSKILDLYRRSWREYMEWRQSRPRSPDELERIDQLLRMRTES